MDKSSPLLQDQLEIIDDQVPSSPIPLAISSILALIPCAEDADYRADDSVVFRRKYAQFLAQAAIESIELEAEIPASSTEPPRALSEDAAPEKRIPFHPNVPIELECIIALDVLSVYEYAQRGNLKKLQNRATEAFANAMMNLSLHTQIDDNDSYAEAKRRVWWMTVRSQVTLSEEEGTIDLQ